MKTPLITSKTNKAIRWQHHMSVRLAMLNCLLRMSEHLKFSVCDQNVRFSCMHSLTKTLKSMCQRGFPWRSIFSLAFIFGKYKRDSVISDQGTVVIDANISLGRLLLRARIQHHCGFGTCRDTSMAPLQAPWASSQVRLVIGQSNQRPSCA